ncbi:MAG: hypothetical protein QOE27_2106 [Solirubrobacteraceae bacterium]|jgi:nucleotide-binding universal stress UspA family protein|nr:hypothetical protein [Solirubrobacteraceae bacterium]
MAGVSPTPDPPSGIVLLCYDGSGEAEAAIRRAAELLAGREALVLVVWTPAVDLRSLDPVSDAVGRASGLYEDWDRIARDVAARHAEAGCAIAVAAGFRARPLTASGKPGPAILRAGDEHDAGVIVLGAGGPAGGIGGLIGGGVGARVAQRARRPVLIVPSEDAPPAAEA